MLQDYLRYMDDFDEGRASRPGRTDPAPPPDMGSVPPHKRQTLPEADRADLEAAAAVDEDAEERRMEREEIEKQRVKSDVRAKRERKTTVKNKKSVPRS